MQSGARGDTERPKDSGDQTLKTHMKLTCSTVGMLVGDSWMCLPAVVDLCRANAVDLICGSYALPVWEWAKAHVVGADYEIVRVIADPDEEACPYRPMLGFPSIHNAAAMLRAEMPEKTILSYTEIGNAYTYGCIYPALKLLDIEVSDGEFVTIHPYTRHSWKNCDMVVAALEFSKPVKSVGEFLRESWQPLNSFDEMVRAVLGSAALVGVLSSFTNLAALFEKKQIIVSYTEDVPIKNPRARVIVKPSVPELQLACQEMGL